MKLIGLFFVMGAFLSSCVTICHSDCCKKKNGEQEKAGAIMKPIPGYMHNVELIPHGKPKYQIVLD